MAEIILSRREIEIFKSMRAQAQKREIGYWEIYKTLADLLESKGVPADDSAVLWLRGATEANAGRGALSELIRSYTRTQYLLRYGEDLSDTLMQEASNQVAENLLGDLLNERKDWPTGKVPDIGRIAISDATSVGRVLFNRDFEDSAAEYKNNSAWSGALLFSQLINEHLPIQF